MPLETPSCKMKEEGLIKDIVIAFMSITDIQRELLMKTRTPLQVLQFTINRKCGQENQRAINTQLNGLHPTPLNQLCYITPNHKNQTLIQTLRPRTPKRNPQPPRNITTPNPCRRCGIQFSPEHLQVCPTKNSSATYAKKIGHYSKVCRSAKCLWQTQQITPSKTSHKPEECGT